MVDLCTSLYAQACNNAVANHRLLGACSMLSADELAAARTSFFPSIIHTLNHNLTVDWYYVSALEGACIGYAAFEPEMPCPRFADLAREQRAVDQRLLDVCRSLTAASVDGIVRVIRNASVDSERCCRVLLHLFQHQIHHRGQVHTMLSGTRSSPPQLDEFFLDSPNERRLRAADLAALGLSEHAIWA